MKLKYYIMTLLVMCSVFFYSTEVQAAPTINGTGQAGSATSKLYN